MKIKTFILNVTCLLLINYIDLKYGLKGILVSSTIVINIVFVNKQFQQKLICEKPFVKNTKILIFGFFFYL